jgi:hypothetical protein
MERSATPATLIAVEVRLLWQQLDHLRYRRHPSTIGDEEHVVAGWRLVRVFGAVAVKLVPEPVKFNGT